MLSYIFKNLGNKPFIIKGESLDAIRQASSIHPNAPLVEVGELSKDSEGYYQEPSRIYFDAWSLNGTSIDIDLVGVRSKNLDSIREQRVALLEEADVEILKLEDASGTTTTWRSYRQELRDMTTVEQTALDALTTVQTIEAHEATWPVKPI